jgi:hypothetical protein
VITAFALAGCTSTASPSAAAASGGASTPTAATTTASTANSKAPSTADKAACTALVADIADTLAKVADAEKIGPPAGHSAVSAQYSAGVAVLYSHMIDASPAVNDAAEAVATAMSQLADTWAKAPKDKPSTAALTTAVDKLKAACGTG